MTYEKFKENYRADRKFKERYAFQKAREAVNAGAVSVSGSNVVILDSSYRPNDSYFKIWREMVYWLLTGRTNCFVEDDEVDLRR